MKKPPLKQKHPELYWRFPSCENKEPLGWDDTLYIALPDGKLEGYYENTLKGVKYEGGGRWESPAFKRNDVSRDAGEKYYPWIFICELK